jgi:hypothetical protein
LLFFLYTALKILAVALLSGLACATKAQRQEQKTFFPLMRLASSQRSKEKIAAYKLSNLFFKRSLLKQIY